MEALLELPEAEEMVIELLKTLYGLMQGGRNWFWTLDEAYKRSGYSMLQADPCICTKNKDSKQMITNTFTDNVFGVSTTGNGVERAKRELAEIYNTKNLGELTFILGIAIT